MDLINIEFGYTQNPSYLDLIVGIYKNVKWYYRFENWKNYSFPDDLARDVVDNYNYPMKEAYPIFYVAIYFTLIRYMFEYFIGKPLSKHLNFDEISDRSKFTESLWKTIVYSIMWFYTVYLVIYTGKYNYFFEPHTMWDGWKFHSIIPDEVKLIYVAECGFYFHSIYSTLFMDTKRKDFKIMLVHHAVTIALLVLSYGYRYHRLGLMVLFCHDVNDILLEYTKCHVYLRKRNRRFFWHNERVSQLGFFTFTFSWCLFRLYWFPLKVIYITAVTGAHRVYLLGAKLYMLFNLLLCIVLLMNLYWFYLIALMVVRVANGTNEDIREDKEKEDHENKNK